MLKIYGADLSTPANKVRFTANYMKLEYEYVQVKIREGDHRKEEFLKINPVGKIPAIDDDGFTLFESSAICRYLAQKNASELYSKDIKEQAVIDSWNDFSSVHILGAMGKILFNRIFAPRLNQQPDERSMVDGKNFLDRFIPVVEKQLVKNKYLCGDRITLADMSLLAATDPFDLIDYDISQHSRLVLWRRELQQQSFYTNCFVSYGESLKKWAEKKNS